MSGSRTQDYLLLHLCIIFWGFTSVLGVLSTLDAPFLVLYRSLLSFLSLMALMYWKKIPMQFPSASSIQLLVAGSLTGFHWITFFASARMSNVSTCLAGMATTALWTSLLEPLMTRSRFQVRELMMALIVASGLLLIFYSDFRLASGLLVSLVSALSCAIFTIMNRNLVRKHSAFQITAWEMGIAFLFTLISLPVLAEAGFIATVLPPEMSKGDMLNIAFLAWVCTVFAYTVSVELMKRLTAFAVTITVNLEPVYGIMLGLLIFGKKEEMQGLFYLGLLVILGGVFSYPFLQSRKKTADK
jgi:drug/metabolite transporter (DMT)-like permease